MVRSILYLVVDSEDNNLKQWYATRIQQHNNNATYVYANSGFDLACPESVYLSGTQKINFQVKASMYTVDYDFPISNIPEQMVPSAYYLYPRSSISNTPFRLANSVGIIDRGYRGHLGAFFDGQGNVDMFQRLVQLCTPTLEPFYVVITNQLTITERNEGGFGSTGV